MIIVEGPDGAGKTTLVKHLSHKFGFRTGERAVADRSKLYTVTRQDTYTAMGLAVSGTSPVRVWDRLFYSELVYATIVGRPVEFTEAERGYTRRILEALFCPVIVCMPPVDTVIANARLDDQMDGVLENLHHIYHAYSELLVEVFPGHALVYDYTGQRKDTVTLDELEEEINDYLAERRERTWC